MRPTRRRAMLAIATSLARLALTFASCALTAAIGLLTAAREARVNLAAGLIALGSATLMAHIEPAAPDTTRQR